MRGLDWGGQWGGGNLPRLWRLVGIRQITFYKARQRKGALVSWQVDRRKVSGTENFCGSVRHRDVLGCLEYARC